MQYQDKKVFLSVPLVALLNKDKPEEQRYFGFYDELALVCKQRGLTVYEPYKHGHPIQHDFIRDSLIYEENRHNIEQADLLIAYVGLMSAGVSMEIEIAHSCDIPVILLYEDAAEKYISRMILGCPAANDRISAPDLQGLKIKFDQRLDAILGRIVAESTNTHSRSQFLDSITKAHERSGLSLQQAGERAAINKGHLSRILSGEVDRPGRDQIIKLCAWAWRLDRKSTNEILKAGGYQQL